MALESRFTQELEFRRLERSMIKDLSRIIKDNPDWDTYQHAAALRAVLDEYYPLEFQEWLG